MMSSKAKTKAELIGELDELRARVATLEENASQLKRAEAANAQFAALGKRLNHLMSTEEATTIILDAADEMFGWDACTLDLYAPESNTVSTVINIDTIDGQRRDVPPTHSGDPLTARMRSALENGSQLILRHEPLTREARSIQFGSSRLSASIMMVTIHGETGVIGFLSIQSYTPAAYDNDDLKMLEALADYCGGTFDRILAEESLRESEEKFRALAQTAESAVLIYQDSKIVYVNPFAAALTGYSPEEQLSMNFWDFIHPDHRDMVQQRGRARLRGETLTPRYEVKLLTKSGVERWLDFSASPIEFRGKPAVLGTALDITERKRTEEHLQKSQARLRHVIYSSPAIVYSLRVDGNRFIPEWVSDSITRLTGYTVNEALQEDWWVRHLHPDDRDRVLAELPRIYDDNHIVNEYRFKHKDEGYHWIHDELRLMRDESDYPVEVIGSWVDVTERREAERALRASEERYRDMVENARDIIYTHDLKGNYTSVNQAVEQITGYTRDEALALNIKKVVAPEYVEIVRRMIADKLAGKKETVYDIEIIAKDGRRITVAVNTRLVQQDGVPIGIQGIARDVTDRKRAEEALRESEAPLQAVLDNCPAMIFQKDLTGRYVQINRQFEQTFSLTPEQALGRTDEELFSPDLAATFKSTDRIVLETGRAQESEEVAEYADGIHTYIVQKFPLQDATGKVYAVGGVSTDITGRKQAEDELRKQKEILQKIIDHIPVMLRFRDEDGRIQLVNQEWQRKLGWTLEEVQARDVDILGESYPEPDYRQEVLDFIAEATGEWKDFKTRTRDGRVIDTTWANIRLKDGTNIGIGRDITEQKRAEEALLAAHARTESVLASVADIHVLLDREGRYLYANQAAADGMGFTKDQILSRTMWEIFPDLVGTELERQYHTAMNERIPVAFDFHYEKNDTWWSNRFFPSPEGLAVFTTDITEQKRAEARSRQKTAQLAALHEIELEISAESELSRVLEVVARRASESQNATFCSVYICDRGGALSIAASLDKSLVGISLKEGEGLSGQVVATGQPEAIDDYSNWEGRARAMEALRMGPALAVPLKWQHTVVGVISLARKPGEEPFTADDTYFLEQIAAESVIAIHQATLFEELQDAHNRLKVLAHSLIHAQESERKRLARELHDRIGQALIAVQIDLQSMQVRLNGNDRLEESLSIIEEALSQVQDLSLELRPSLLDDLGLVSALRWYVERTAERGRLLRFFSADPIEMRLAPQFETACFRIAQEALTNVVRHAHAKVVGIRLKSRETDIQLIIKDDGNGFPVIDVMSRNGTDTSLGLQGMRERAAALGGTVEITSGPGKGTEVRATFPLASAVLSWTPENVA